MSALNFNIEILGIDCAIEFLYSEKFAMKMLLPLIILVVVLTVYVLTWLVSTTAEACHLKAGRLKNLERFHDACIGAYIIFFYFVYLELARTALDVSFINMCFIIFHILFSFWKYFFIFWINKIHQFVHIIH
jgi:hypothetical protein